MLKFSNIVNNISTGRREHNKCRYTSVPEPVQSLSLAAVSL